MVMSLYDASSGVNCSENSSPFKYVWLASSRLFCNPRIERNEKEKSVIQKSFQLFGCEKKLRKQVNKNILYENVGGI